MSAADEPREEGGGQALARVADPAALDACEGTRARLDITVPADWLVDGSQLELDAPRRLLCDRCEGGGCDSCDKSGALRAPKQVERRKLRLSLPARDSDEAVCVRVSKPFHGSAIAQLLVRVRPGERDARVRRVAKALAVRGAAPTPLRRWLPLGVALVALLVILAVLLR